MSNQLIKAAIDILNKKPSYLGEELTPTHQRGADRMVDNGHSHYQSKFLIDHAAPDTYNKFQYDPHTSKKVIRIPVTLNQDKADPSHTVHNFLKEKGYNIKDTESYRAGLAHKEIVTGNPDKGIPYRSKQQPYKIGSLLQKHDAPDSVVHAYTHDPVRASGKNNDFDIVLSNHPHDVYGMSTGRGWTSCASLDSPGPAAKHMSDEINNHTHVAYLVPRGGNHDTDAVARLAFKHHTALSAEVEHGPSIGTTSYKPKHQTLVSEGTVYGQAPTDFRTVAEHEVRKLFPMKNDIYVKNPHVYNDNGKQLHVQEGNKVSSEQLDTAWKQIPKESKHHLYQHVGLEGKFKSKNLRDVQTALKTITAEPTGNFVDDIDRVTHATYGLDSDQKYNGIDRNANITQDMLHHHMQKVMSGFDINNSEHNQSLRIISHDHPLRHKLYAGLSNTIKPVRTPEEFENVNKIHKVLGNRSAESIDLAPDHQLGGDPFKTLAKSGVLKDVNDYKKAYYSTYQHSEVKDNWYGHIHRLADENMPNAHLALQDASHELDHIYKRGDGSNGAFSYMSMNPNARHYYSNQLGHDPAALMEKHKDYLDKLFKR